MKPIDDTNRPEGNQSREPDAGENRVLQNFPHAREAEAVARLKVVRIEGERHIIPDHPNETVGNRLIMERIGTADDDFRAGLIEQLANGFLLTSGTEEHQLNFILAVIKGIKPRDQIETLLASQMAAIHQASLRFLAQLPLVEHTPQQDSVQRALNQTTRTFIAQMEALERHRTGGGQVTVRHVSVSEGGQAIVGNVTHAPREAARAAAPADTTARTAAPSIAPSQEEPMPLIVDAEPAAAKPGSAAGPPAAPATKPSMARPRRGPGK